MNNPLVTLTVDAADEIVKKLTQSSTLVALISDATEVSGDVIENEMVNNAMWLLFDLLDEITAIMSHRQYAESQEPDKTCRANLNNSQKGSHE
ncbi:hypothetical protein PT276_02710 [Orbaceae bacterium ESL0721]|nr:hypothetical protein [Orbaceae bacterium ESL0721]